jgi:von Willebrand factor type A domain
MYGEVAMLIDSSNKPDGAFNSMIGFAQSIAYSFAYLGQNLVRLAAVRYSDTPVVQFNLNWNIMWNDWGNNPFINITYTGGGSNLSAALDLLRTSVFTDAVARPGVPKVAIVITDNLQAPDKIMLTAAANVKAAGIRVAVVGILNNNQTDQQLLIKKLYNDTVVHLFLPVPDYSLLSSVLPAVMNFSSVVFNPSTSGECYHKIQFCLR